MALSKKHGIERKRQRERERERGVWGGEEWEGGLVGDFLFGKLHSSHY